MTKAIHTQKLSLFSKRIFFIVVSTWTVIIVAIVAWEYIDYKGNVVELAYVQANFSFEKDLLYRRWVALHGGVYVPVTK